MRKLRWIAAGGLLTFVVAGLFVCSFDLLPVAEIEDGDYPLQPVLETVEPLQSELGWMGVGEQVWWNVRRDKKTLLVGSGDNWETVPDRAVKSYPELKSSRALYGQIAFGKGRTEPPEGKAFHCVVDESGGTGKGYDRLYFDANGDLDLTNDPVLVAASSPWYSRDGRTTPFQPLTISFDFGPDFGERPVQILPRLTELGQSGNSRVGLSFVVPDARGGSIQIGRQRYNALIGQLLLVTGRFDKPTTALHLTPRGRFSHLVGWQSWNGETLASFHCIDGKLYTIAATPTGDMLKVRRYRGELGKLRIEPGQRKITDLRMCGWLATETMKFPIGQMAHNGESLEMVRECEVPAGDYSLSQMECRYGRLAFKLSPNHFRDGNRREAMERPGPRAIKIRKDQTFVLNFSNRPEIVFASPARGQSFKAGDEVVVATVLTDPVLGSMIRDLDYASRKESRKNGDRAVKWDASLVPTVKILDAAGKTVASGTMPFG